MTETDKDLDELITLQQAAAEYPLVYSTLAKAAQQGRLEAVAIGGTERKTGVWLVTRRAIEDAIKAGRLKPRR